MRTVIAGIGLAISLSLAQRLPAQHTEPVSSKDCERAASVVAMGNVSNSNLGAFLTLTGCGTVGANAFANGIAKLATETDTAKLEIYMTAADNWTDAAILTAATQLATKTSATPQARVYAVRHLITRLQPLSQFTYAGLAMGTDTTTLADGTKRWTYGCMGSMTSARWGRIPGSSLPAHYDDQIRSTLATLASTTSTPAPVRNAAKCLQTP